MADAVTVAPGAGLDGRRLVALALPVAVPVAMTAVFGIANERLGSRGGYLAGFGVYWATCGAISFAVLGRRRARQLFRDTRPRLGRPAVLGAVLLLWLPAGAIATRMVPRPRGRDTGDGRDGDDGRPRQRGARGASRRARRRTSRSGRGPAGPGIWPAIGFGAWKSRPR